MLKPHLEEKVERRQTGQAVNLSEKTLRRFVESQPVMFRDVRRNSWVPAAMVDVNRPRTYTVVSESQESRLGHFDHMRSLSTALKALALEAVVQQSTERSISAPKRLDL